jgi:hypothetical protein
MRGWMLLGLGLLALALVVGNAILLAGMFSSGSLERSLSLTEKSANEQKPNCST